MINALRHKADRFIEYCRTFGVARSVRFLARLFAARLATRLANLVLSRRVECPCCGWSGHRFNDYIEVGYRLGNYVCPSCGSQPRHRYFHLWLQGTFGLAEKKGKCVVFAFEQPLAKLWREAKGLKVVRTDLQASPSVDVIADIERLPFAAGSVDLVWCHHVFEHVADDRAGMRELRRILRRPTGQIIVSVPMFDATETLEYGRADPAESGHRRRYGADFAARLAEAGLHCEAARMELPAADMAQYGICPDPYFICTADGGV